MFSLTTSMIAAILAAGAFAVPTSLTPRATVGDAGNFQLIGYTGGRDGPDLNGVPINAHHYGFYMGKKTTAICNARPKKYCPPDNATALYTAGEGAVGMMAEVPGGQTFFIAADGSLSYSHAHSSELPDGATATEFIWNSTYAEGFGMLYFRPNGSGPTAGPGDFLACPTGKKGAHVIKYPVEGVKYSKNCVSIGLATVNYTATLPPSFQYD